MALRVGLTGGVAAGKSTVSAMLARSPFVEVVGTADVIADASWMQHDLVTPRPFVGGQPGGGFVGGLVVASAFVLYSIAYGVSASRRALLVDPSTLLAVAPSRFEAMDEVLDDLKRKEQSNGDGNGN